MESIIRNVRDLAADNRTSLESVLGHRLDDDQQVIIRVLTPGTEPDAATKLAALQRAGCLAAQAAQHRERRGVTPGEADEVVDEALERIRRWASV